MLALMEDEDAAPTARATAARALALIERDAPDTPADRPISEMTVEELDAIIATELQRRAGEG